MATLVSGRARAETERRLGSSWRIYRGRSMWGTFEAGDWLRLDKVSMGELRPGDVVVAAESGADRGELVLVHRIREIREQGLVLRGDNNDADDRELVTEERLLGRVSRLERGNVARRVSGGLRGRLWAACLRMRRALVRRFMRTGRGKAGWLYRWLRKKGALGWIWRPRLQRIRLVIEGEVFVSYRYRGREVARRHPRTGHLRCRKPFDLILKSRLGRGGMEALCLKTEDSAQRPDPVDDRCMEGPK